MLFSLCPPPYSTGWKCSSEWSPRAGNKWRRQREKTLGRDSIKRKSSHGTNSLTLSIYSSTSRRPQKRRGREFIRSVTFSSINNSNFYSHFPLMGSLGVKWEPIRETFNAITPHRNTSTHKRTFQIINWNEFYNLNPKGTHTESEWSQLWGMRVSA